MNFKVFAAFFVTLLAVHASSQSPLKDDSIKEIVLAIFDAILGVTGPALEKVNSLVDDLEQNEEEVTQKVVDFAVQEGKKVNEAVLSLVDELKDGATDDGKAVVTCIEGEQDKTDAAFEDTATVVGNCAAAELSVIIPEVRVILGQLGDLQTDVQGQVDTLTACSDSELTCLVAFAGTAVTTIKKIPAIVTDDINQVIELVKTVVDDLTKCDIATGVKAHVQEIFNEAVVCIKS